MRVRVLSLFACLALASAPAAAQSIALNGTPPPTGVTVGAATPVTIDVSGGPGNTTDWIALYPSGAADSGYLAWSYLNGATSPPATGLTSATLSVIAPVTAGSYEWRLFANNGTTRLATSAALTVTASTAVLTVNGAVAPAPASAVSGGSIVVAIANGPGNTTDWVALAPAGAPDTAIVDWRYVNGTTVAPATGMTSGTVTFIAPATPGAYEVRFFAVNSYARLTTSGPLTVAASPAALTVNGVGPPTAVPVTAGTYVTLGVTDGPGNPGDWVGLYAVGTADSALLSWRYLNGLTTLPATGLTNAALSFGAPLTAGSYEFRFFSANTYTRLATSTSLVVSAATAQLSVNGTAAPGSTTALPGTQVVVSVASGPGNAGDWVGLYLAGTSDTAVLDWRYLNDTATSPATGLTTGTLTFRVPTPASTYEFRFFMDNTYGRLATSGPLVVPQTPAQIAVNGVAPPTSVTVNPGSTVTATVSGGPGNPTDWIALAAQGAADASFLSWQYLNGLTQPPAGGVTSGTLSVTLPSTPGTYELRLYASNSYQRIVTSAPIIASAAPPVVTVALISPFPGTTFNAPASLTLTATASITGGALQRVEFYDGPTLIGSSTAPPYQTTWFGPSPGLHTLTAVAVDSSGALTASTPVPVVIDAAGATIGTLAPPVGSPPGGVYGAGQSVTITAAPGVTIRYTTDGSVPDQTSAVYSGSLTLTQGIVLQARAYQSGWTESAASTDNYVIDTTGPTIVPIIAPGRNAAGWNNTPVTISFECSDASTVASCPSPVTVSQEGAGQLVTVTAADGLGHQSSLTVTVNIDTVAPVVTLSSPTADLSTVDTTLPITGSVTDVGSGVGLARCGALAATVSGNTATCTVPLLPGQNSLALVAIDLAGNSSSAGFVATRTVAPTTIVLAPTKLTLAVGDTRALTVTSDIGLSVPGVIWTSSDTGVVSIDPASDGTVIAEGLGQATVTATLGSLTSTAIVRVLPSSVPAGETIWSAAPPSGRYLQAPLRANPALDDDPDIFSVEVDAATSGILVRAVRAADGATLWSEPVPERPQVADAFGGFLVRSTVTTNGVATQVLHRIGGGGVVPWVYASSGAIWSAAAAADGTVYLAETALKPTPEVFPNSYRADSFVVGLDGRTGAVRFRVWLPNGSARWPQDPGDGSCAAPRLEDGGTLGAITVLENGDAAVQQAVQHFRIAGDCNAFGSLFRSVDLIVWRVSPPGAATGTTVHSFARTWPNAVAGVGDEEITPFVNRPDGHGGILSTWQKVTTAADGNHPYDAYVSRVVPGGGVAFQQPAPWALYWDDRERGDVMIASDGLIYVPGMPNGEIQARNTTSWSLAATFPVAGSPLNGLGDDGITVLAAGTILHFDQTGEAEDFYQTAISSAISTADESVLYGVDDVGALSQVSVIVAKKRSIWSMLGGVISACRTGVLFFDLPVSFKALQPRLIPYVYDFKLDNSDSALNTWSDEQKLGVEEAFDTWQNTVVEQNLVVQGTGMTIAFQKAQSPLAVVDIWVSKHDFLAETPPRPNSAGRFVERLPLTNGRSQGGTLLLSVHETKLKSRKGYRRTTLHEIGHALGLAHPSATPSDPDGDPETDKSHAGGTVMNANGRLAKAKEDDDFRDDAANLVANSPTRCDVDAVRRSLQR